MPSPPDWNKTCIEPVSRPARLEHVQRCSPFAAGLVERNPAWLEQLESSGRLDDASAPDPKRAGEWIAAHGLDDGLRNFRNQEMLRIVWRDLNGLAPLGEVFTDLTTLAETCLRKALDFHHSRLSSRFGQPLNKDGRAQSAVIIGLGKLGGTELNLSSDIDLVFCYPEAGHCDGRRRTSNGEFFRMLSREVISALGAVRPTGFCFRVDTRLRPFGQAGAIACSFAAMEQYYQREGRDWERYALIKARPVAGDITAGRRLLDLLKPFVYRRYIDFGAIESLREMQSLIRTETARADRSDDIKRGPGGIREIEFLAQGFQLLRGGRDAMLQTPGLGAALRAIEQLELLPRDVVDQLRSNYITLRHIENRIQAMRDQQTHRIPAGEDRLRLLRGLGLEDSSGLDALLARVRGQVARCFDETWSGGQAASGPGDDSSGQSARWQTNWTEWHAAGQIQDHPDAGLPAAPLNAFLASLARRPMGQKASRRLDRFMPMLLERMNARRLPTQVVNRLLDLVLLITQRSAYLSLLAENPKALDRAIDLFSRSRWVAERVSRFPELLDELIDPSLGRHIPDRETMQLAVSRQLHSDDEEAALAGLNYLRQAHCLRLAVAWLEDLVDEPAVHQSLTDIAEVMVEATMTMARRHLERRHGTISNSALAVIGYGSLGAREPGFDSDLDLVFLYEPGEGESDGERRLEAERWFARLAQRMVGFLTALTPSGKLYEIDTRLRPNGRSGLLVSSMRAYATYQREEAWTWEAQALTRARAIAGDASLIARFDEVRRDCLCRERDPDALGSDLLDMRARVRESFAAESGSGNDIKHSPGGMVDIGFLAQLGVLLLASRHPALAEVTGVWQQLRGLHDSGWLDDDQLRLLESRLKILRKIRIEQALASTECAGFSEEDLEQGRAIAELFNSLARGRTP